MDVTSAISRLPRIRLGDPRCYQIIVLSLLLAVAVAGLDIGIRAPNTLATIATALGVQWLATRVLGLPRYDPWSALITSLSLTLLLRTDLVIVSALAAALAIGSKFLIRIRGKHVFNPANFAIVVLIVASDHAWISTGQWGSAAIGAFALACLGFVVLTRARRAETTLAFLASFAILLSGRALWLGDPLSIPVHQLANGALLIFAFFMISDPKTTPDSRAGRVVFGSLVACVAFAIRFGLYEAAAPIFALILCSPLVPVIDALRRGERYRWVPSSTVSDPLPRSHPVSLEE